LGHQVGELVDDVDGRPLRLRPRRGALHDAERLPGSALERTPGRRVHGTARATDDRSRRGARYEQAAYEQRQHADDRHAAPPQREPETAPEDGADVAALVLAEGDHQAEPEDDQA